MENTNNSKIAFVYQCYKQDLAFIKCLDNVRRHYPNADIIVLNDKGNDYREICEYFKCDYTYFNENLDVHFDVDKLNTIEVIEKYRKYLYRMFYALSKTNAEYFMRLEDDVKIRGIIYHIPDYDVVGALNVYCNYNENTNAMIRIVRGRQASDTKQYLFNCGGGSLIRRTTFLEYIKETIDNIKLLEIFYLLNPKNYMTVDVTDGLGLLLKGCKIGRSVCIFDNTAKDNNYKGFQHSVVNQYKKYYNMEIELGNFKSYLHENKKK